MKQTLVMGSEISKIWTGSVCLLRFHRITLLSSPALSSRHVFVVHHERSITVFLCLANSRKGFGLKSSSAPRSQAILLWYVKSLTSQMRTTQSSPAVAKKNPSALNWATEMAQSLALISCWRKSGLYSKKSFMCFCAWISEIGGTLL
eukprot:TRINITY_DN2016_c0_g2_i10.p2 TRINITY_DN2016_c0_g2~~TRINITY_DN2016_c0_g2_i10.p2  ORF type:complete len:147 (+),score=28.22 TRINITY_DN2016_c0_g2_i10:610-1050(+)